MVRRLGSGFACGNHLRTCLIAVLSIIISGCNPSTPNSTPIVAVPASSPTSSLFSPTATPEALDEHVREAFRVEDPDSRRDAVLMAVRRFLRDDAVRNLSDADASLMLTQIAFSSERLVLTDAALMARDGEWAVVGLPDGLGLYLYDLGDADAAPLELSRWTVGLSSLRASWGATEVGVVYTTLGSDGAMQAHFVLAVKEPTWAVAWLSDETPDWWFNTRNADIVVAPDRTWILVKGEALDTTRAFSESSAGPLRTFHMEWQRTENSYQPESPAPPYSPREVWLWAAAEPSPYATLVEFIERLQLGDEDGALGLVSREAVVADAISFGIYLVGRQYEVVSYNEERIVFRDVQGTFVANFRQSASGEPRWLITNIAPFGAEP